MKTIGQFETVWDNTLEAVCVWWYSPDGFREHVGTFRAQYHGRIPATARDAMRQIQADYNSERR